MMTTCRCPPASARDGKSRAPDERIQGMHQVVIDLACDNLAQGRGKLLSQHAEESRPGDHDQLLHVHAATLHIQTARQQLREALDFDVMGIVVALRAMARMICNDSSQSTSRIRLTRPE